MFLDKSDLKAMMEFNEKADKLNNNNFTKRIMSEGFGVNFHLGKDEPIVVAKKFPIDEEIESFVLTIRLFTLKQDIPNMDNFAKNIYSKLPDNCKEKTNFISANNILNDYLDSPYDIIKIDGEEITHRGILNTFLYGELAHVKNDVERRRYKKWMEHDMVGSIYKSEFISVLTNMLRCILFMQEMNNSLINDYDNWFKM